LSKESKLKYGFSGMQGQCVWFKGITIERLTEPKINVHISQVTLIGSEKENPFSLLFSFNHSKQSKSQPYRYHNTLIYSPWSLEL
jgi:hypothetical protein